MRWICAAPVSRIAASSKFHAATSRSASSLPPPFAARATCFNPRAMRWTCAAPISRIPASSKLFAAVSRSPLSMLHPLGPSLPTHRLSVVCPKDLSFVQLGNQAANGELMGQCHRLVSVGLLVATFGCGTNTEKQSSIQEERSMDASPLEKAIERGMKPGGDLVEELRNLKDYPIRLHQDAKARS